MLMHIIFSAGPSNIQFIPSTTYYSLQSGSFMPLVMCMADCNTTCTYKWTKNGMYIARQTLNVSRVSSSSAGTYTCTASEGTKLVTKSLRLYVPCKYTIVVLRKMGNIWQDKPWLWVESRHQVLVLISAQRQGAPS